MMEILYFREDGRGGRHEQGWKLRSVNVEGVGLQARGGRRSYWLEVGDIRRKHFQLDEDKGFVYY